MRSTPIRQQDTVAEYWIVDPRALTIDIYVLEQGTYVLMSQYRMALKLP
jgi:Uma2 family endonuclease